MTLTLGKIKNTKQAKRAITAIQSAFNITPIIGKEIIVKDNTEALKTKDNEISILSDLSKKQAKDIEELNAHIEDLNNQLSDLSNKESDIRSKYNNLKVTYDQLNAHIEDEVGTLNEKIKSYIKKNRNLSQALEHGKVERNELLERYLKLKEKCNPSQPFDLSTIDTEEYITPKCCNDVVTQNILKDGFSEPKEVIVAKKPKGILDSLPAPKMDGSLMKDEYIEEVSGGVKTAFENGLEGRVMIDSEEDYTPPKIDLSVRAIPLKIFIRDKEKSINNSDSKNEEIRRLLSGYRVIEIESNVTVNEYKNMYSKLAKYLNRDTLKLIKKIFLASSSNTVKKAYRKPYYDLLTKIYNIIITDRLPIDDIESQKEADNTKPIAEDKNHLKSDIEAIKASIEAKTKQAIDKIENPAITTRDEVFKYAINQVKVAKIEADRGIPMPYAKVQKVLKDLESFISKKDILHLLNILIGDDIFRGNSYDRYIPNIKYWGVLRGIKKGLKAK